LGHTDLVIGSTTGGILGPQKIVSIFKK
jgi:hypothetical protein